MNYMFMSHSVHYTSIQSVWHLHVHVQVLYKDISIQVCTVHDPVVITFYFNSIITIHVNKEKNDEFISYLNESSTVVPLQDS